MSFKTGENVQIHESAIINVSEGYIGAGTIIREGVRIEGTRVLIGRECFLDRFSSIGGGSCFDPQASLECGDWLHMGVSSHINIARGVKIGHEFGFGMESKLFTHGAYLDSYNLGAPFTWDSVTIGDNVWMSNAWVNPGVQIGDNVIILPRSYVRRKIPSGSLAGGADGKVIKSNFLPRALTKATKQKILEQIVEQTVLRWSSSKNMSVGQDNIYVKNGKVFINYDSGISETVFNIPKKNIVGSADEAALIFRDQLRRNGIRFRYYDNNGKWKKWGQSPLCYS